MNSRYGYAAASDFLAHLEEANRRLADLMVRVRSANRAFAEAARPLAERPELSEQAKKEIARELRAAERECEDVAQLTTRELANLDSLCCAPPPGNVGAARSG